MMYAKSRGTYYVQVKYAGIFGLGSFAQKLFFLLFIVP